MGGNLGLQGIAQVHIEVVRAGEVFKGAAMGLFAAGDNGIAEHQGVGLYLLGGKAQLSPQVGPGATIRPGWRRSVPRRKSP